MSGAAHWVYFSIMQCHLEAFPFMLEELMNETAGSFYPEDYTWHTAHPSLGYELQVMMGRVQLKRHTVFFYEELMEEGVREALWQCLTVVSISRSM